MVDCLASFFVISNKFGWHIASRCRFPGLPESVLLDFFDAEPLHVRLTQAEELDEVGAIHITYKLGLDWLSLPTSLVMILKCLDMVIEY